MSLKSSTLVVFATLVGLDRVTKIYFMNRSAASGPVLFPGWLEIVQHKNFGIVANLPVPQWLIVIATFVILGFLTASVGYYFKENKRPELLALVMVLAGAIGNLWDRLRWGFVYDWILFFGISAVNLADASIAIGLIWFLFKTQTKKSASP